VVVVAVPLRAFRRFARRDLRRAAVFLWMMPRLAALSTRLDVALKIVCDASSSPPAIVVRLFFTNVLIADFTDWFRRRRLRDLITSFFADLEFGTFLYLVCVPDNCGARKVPRDRRL
jgi:hypothetical protein